MDSTDKFCAEVDEFRAEMDRATNCNIQTALGAILAAICFMVAAHIDSLAAKLPVSALGVVIILVALLIFRRGYWIARVAKAEYRAYIDSIGEKP